MGSHRERVGSCRQRVGSHRQPGCPPPCSPRAPQRLFHLPQPTEVHVISSPPSAPRRTSTRSGARRRTSRLKRVCASTGASGHRLPPRSPPVARTRPYGTDGYGCTRKEAPPVRRKEAPPFRRKAAPPLRSPPQERRRLMRVLQRVPQRVPQRMWCLLLHPTHLRLMSPPTRPLAPPTLRACPARARSRRMCTQLPPSSAACTRSASGSHARITSSSKSYSCRQVS